MKSDVTVPGPLWPVLEHLTIWMLGNRSMQSRSKRSLGKRLMRLISDWLIRPTEDVRRPCLDHLDRTKQRLHRQVEPQNLRVRQRHLYLWCFWWFACRWATGSFACESRGSGSLDCWKSPRARGDLFPRTWVENPSGVKFPLRKLQSQVYTASRGEVVPLSLRGKCNEFAELAKRLHEDADHSP